MIKNYTLEIFVLAPKYIGPKYFWAQVGTGLKYYWGQIIPRTKMCLGPKYAWGQSGLGAKLGVSRIQGSTEGQFLKLSRTY